MRAVLALTLGLVGCGSASSGGTPPAVSAPGSGVAPAPPGPGPAAGSAAQVDTGAPVGGTLTIIGPQPAASPSELRLRATATNYAHQGWLAPVVPLSIAQLSIIVTDAHGARMPTYPPPVPQPGDDRRELVAQGQSRTYELSLPMDLPPGTYTVTWGVAAGVSGATATFTIQ